MLRSDSGEWKLYYPFVSWFQYTEKNVLNSIYLHLHLASCLICKAQFLLFIGCLFIYSFNSSFILLVFIKQRITYCYVSHTIIHISVKHWLPEVYQGPLNTSIFIIEFQLIILLHFISEDFNSCFINRI